MNQNEEIRVLYVQPGKYPEKIKIPNTLETFQKYVCGSIESVRLGSLCCPYRNPPGSTPVAA